MLAVICRNVVCQPGKLVYLRKKSHEMGLPIHASGIFGSVVRFFKFISNQIKQLIRVTYTFLGLPADVTCFFSSIFKYFFRSIW